MILIIYDSQHLKPSKLLFALLQLKAGIGWKGPYWLRNFGPIVLQSEHPTLEPWKIYGIELPFQFNKNQSALNFETFSLRWLQANTPTKISLCEFNEP